MGTARWKEGALVPRTGSAGPIKAVWKASASECGPVRAIRGVAELTGQAHCLIENRWGNGRRFLRKSAFELPTHEQPSDRPALMNVLRLPAVLKRTGLSRMTIYRLENRGAFPQRVQLSPNSVGWRESEVDEWVRTRAAPTRSPELGVVTLIRPLRDRR